MDPVTVVEPTVRSRAASSDPKRPAGLLKETQQLWEERYGLAHDPLQLAAPETQLEQVIRISGLPCHSSMRATRERSR